MLHPPALARLVASLTAAVVLSTVAAEARAQAAPPSEPPRADPARDAPTPAPTDVWANVHRPWLYAADPTAPPPGHVLTSLLVGYAAIDRDGSRPFAGNVANAGAVFSAAAEVGILGFLSLRAEGLLAGQEGSVKAGAMIGPNFYLLRPGGPIGISLSAGYLRELGGDNGVWGRAAIAGQLGKARFVFTALGEHVFTSQKAGVVEEERDGIDLVLTTGATYALMETFRLGVEYVVQDLEGVWDPEEAEGGVRHFVGPVASLELARHIQVTAGPAFGLSKGSPAVLGRLAAMYAF